MSYFPRQKRQARFYWAELGFLVMGLFALQPSLLTSLFSNVMPKPTLSYDRLNYLNSQSYNGLMGRDWSGGKLVQSYMAAPPAWQNQALANWNPQLGYGSNQLQPGASYSPSSHGGFQPTYASYNNTGLAGHSLPSQGSWPNYASPTQLHSDLLSNTPANYYSQNPLPYPTTAANAWNGQPSYVAQGHSSWPNSSNYSNPSNYLNGSYYNRGNQAASGWPSTNSNNPFNSLLTKAQQSNLPRNGDGAGGYNPSAQRYAYPASSTGFDSWTPYQPSGSSLYR